MTGVWEHVDDLVAPARSLSDLRAHRLQLIAAERWRRHGLPVPDGLREEERLFGLYGLAVDALLQRVRAAVTGPILIFKGPETAAHYPAPSVRPFVDVDLVVPGPEAARRSLLSAGFVPAGHDETYYFGLHHVQPLRWPNLPLRVELHHHPNWIEWARPPSIETLLEGAVAARVGPPGAYLAPNAEQHALILAVNSWTDSPLRRVLDLIDVAVVLSGTDPASVQPLADEWDVGGIWRATTAAMSYLLDDGRRPLSMRTWARATAEVRDLTVAENHLRRLASLFWSLPPHRALRFLPRTLAREFLPGDDEAWAAKRARIVAALRHPFRSRADHDRRLADEAHLLSPRLGPGRDDAPDRRTDDG